jgi:hypothetical protein
VVDQHLFYSVSNFRHLTNPRFQPKRHNGLGNPCRASLRSVRLLSSSSRFRPVRIVPNYFPSTYRGTNSVQRDHCTTILLVAYHFYDSPEVFVQSDLSAATVACITSSSSTDHYENDVIAFGTDGRKRACGVRCMGVMSSQTNFGPPLPLNPQGQ